MVLAYIMVKANTGDADRLLDEVKTIEGVQSAHIVAGDVDLIVKVSVDGPEDVKNVAANEMQTISGIEDTETYLAMD
ncbi:MAG: Lrp/AsnC family transcriptional regulator [Halobacteriaceae archaeon]